MEVYSHEEPGLMDKGPILDWANQSWIASAINSGPQSDRRRFERGHRFLKMIGDPAR